jgi:hypothetical protein
MNRDGGHVRPMTSSGGATGRRAKRTLGARKFIGLKIDAELPVETPQPIASDGKNDTTASAITSATLDDDDDAIPWWILEYQAPPPGHLGAHNMPITAALPSSTRAVRTQSMCTTETKMEQMEVTPAVENAQAGSRQFHDAVVVEHKRDHETPERARRKLKTTETIECRTFSHSSLSLSLSLVLTFVVCLAYAR